MEVFSLIELFSQNQKQITNKKYTENNFAKKLNLRMGDQELSKKNLVLELVARITRDVRKPFFFLS